MDCERLNSPVLSFVDINGKPLVGGKLHTYLAGTSTPATTYRDIEGTEANENPIILNGRGECVCFLDCSKTYKVVLKDSHDVVIWSQDNVFPNNIAELARVVVDNSDAIDELNDKKADKVAGATDNNFAALDANGNLKDSGKNASDFAPSSLGDVAVRTDVVQNFDATNVKQGRDNIKAQKDIGGPGAFIDAESIDSTNVWAQIGELNLESLGIATGRALARCYSNISLSLEFTVYNTGNTDGAIVERGRFDINVHADPSNGKWNYDAQWTSYDSRVAGTHIIDSMRVSKKMNGSEIKTLTLYAKVPDPSTFKDNALNVSVLKNYGTTHRTDNMNTVKSFVKPWTLWICIVWRTFTLGTNESPIPIARYLSGNHDSYVDFPTVHAPQLSVLDTPRYTQTDGNDAVKRGNLPVIVYEDGGGAVAWPIQVSDSGQHFSSINTNRSMSVFGGGLSGNIEYLARFSSTKFMTPTIDTTIVGLYIVGEDYLYPMDGQTHSISVFFEVVDPGSHVYNVLATWRRSGTDDPKEFKIAVTYFGNTVGCWHGTKTLSTTETALTITDFANMVKLEIDFISTDGERWYHFEYIKEANRSRMVEY